MHDLSDHSHAADTASLSVRHDIAILVAMAILRASDAEYVTESRSEMLLHRHSRQLETIHSYALLGRCRLRSLKDCQWSCIYSL